MEIKGQAVEQRCGLVRILFRGMVIDAKAQGSRIVDLVVRAEDQDSRPLRRFLQYLANTLYRAGDMLNPGNHNGLPRVIEAMMFEHKLDDGLANPGHIYAVNRIPSRLANSEASYETFIIYEGVENKKLESLAAGGVDTENLFDMSEGIRNRLNECANNVHVWP
jgi:predicted nucleotidyltransferase